MILFDNILIILPIIIYIVSFNKYLALSALLFCLIFLRSPDKNNFIYKNDIFYSPSAGTIRDIKEENDNIIVSLFLNIFDNHTQYIPINSIYKNKNHLHGIFLPAFNEHSINNERIVNELYSIDYNFDYTVTQITGVLTHRIYSYPKINEKKQTGDKLGFILLGSRVDIKVPKKYIKNILKYQHISSLTPLFKLSV